MILVSVLTLFSFLFAIRAKSKALEQRRRHLLMQLLCCDKGFLVATKDEVEEAATSGM